MVDRPRRITHTWAHEPVGDTTEHTQVTVRFENRGQGTEVIVVHQGLWSAHSRETHGAGWGECLDRLAALAPADRLT